jgi:hypothetical protein
MTEIQVKGVFQITGWDETPYLERQDGAKQSNAKITQSYLGGIEGCSELQYLMCYTSDGNAVFVGLETITGVIEGRSGSFVLQHQGTFAAGVARSSLRIVAHSGQGELANIAGEGCFESGENGQANYQMAVSL